MTEELAHAGVKGMKWGVRRSVKKPSGKKPAPRSADYSEYEKMKSKPTSSLSNKQLKTLNERRRLETQNRELFNKGGLQKIKTGTTAVGAVLAVGTTAVTAINLAKGPLGQSAKKAISKALRTT